ncbi:YdcH family protein [Loktanella sp. SALINAS62]|uniref:YdcH family protein n=1 Tax=Loktanella sp. SALINAS62 TaxID=2706124 RepID=UPI001B8BB083|nr:YdcH family protein [Loktanella sp. SALINAS62]MBS1302091.1 YdcH family protein [Loktanella sp. SALINAS62]
MSLNSHITELKKKHQTLSDSVEQMQKRAGSDDMEIARLKKEKLMLKEEITRLSV